MAVPQRVLDIMRSGDVYLCDDEEMLDAQRAQLELLYDFNATRPGEAGRRATLLQRLLGSLGEGSYVEPPLHANWGCNTFIGANVTILPGVTIGENSVIGAGSVVTKDIPANVIAYGSPCRVAREIGEHDDVYYWRDRVINAPFEKREA